MPFSRSKLLLGFVIIVALVIIAGTLGAAKDVNTKMKSQILTMIWNFLTGFLYIPRKYYKI